MQSSTCVTLGSLSHIRHSFPAVCIVTCDPAAEKLKDRKVIQCGQNCALVALLSWSRFVGQVGSEVKVYSCC